MDLGKKIKNLRINKGLSCLECSKQIGIKQSTLFYIENGRNNPTIETLKKICIFFNISSDELLELKFKLK